MNVPLPKFEFESYTRKEFNEIKRKFSNYMIANEVIQKPREVQVAHLRLCVDEKINDIIDNLNLNGKTVDELFAGLEEELIPKDGVCFQQLEFHRRSQKLGMLTPTRQDHQPINNNCQEDMQDMLSSLFRLPSHLRDVKDTWFQKFTLQNKEIQFKLDTGADLNVIPIAELHKFGLAHKIKPCTTKAETYGGYPLTFLELPPSSLSSLNQNDMSNLEINQEIDDHEDNWYDTTAVSNDEDSNMFDTTVIEQDHDYLQKTRKEKTQWIGINQIIEDLAFEASVAMFIALIEDLQVQGQQGQHLTFHI
ncbi:hypothetical protein M8J77_001891 [Diaphorina citri]|nr:hypothetical protein M8J77_001891 [Diaphorina citri]